MTCMVMCDAYDGPARPTTEQYIQGLPQYTRDKTLIAAAGKILVNAPPTTAYIGDRMGAAIGKMTGRKPCYGCRKVEGALNWGHRSLKRLLT